MPVHENEHPGESIPGFARSHSRNHSARAIALTRRTTDPANARTEPVRSDRAQAKIFLWCSECRATRKPRPSEITKIRLRVHVLEHMPREADVFTLADLNPRRGRRGRPSCRRPCPHSGHEREHRL